MNSDITISYCEELFSASPSHVALKQLVAAGYRLVDVKEKWLSDPGIVRVTIILRRKDSGKAAA